MRGRFLELQRATLFASAAAAFGSVAVSRELPAWALLLFGLAFCLGPFVRERRLCPPWVLNLPTAVGVVIALVPGLLRRELLPVAAAEAATLLCANRLLLRREAGDDGLLHLACWLCLASGAALTADLLYGLCLALYAGLVAVSMTLAELRRGIEEETARTQSAEQARALLAAPELTSRRLLSFAASLGLGSLAFGALLFPIFPRAHAGLWQGLGGGSLRTGISDRVDLTAKGTLTDSSRLVLTAELRPAGDAPAAAVVEARYWRTLAFEQFTGRGWLPFSTTAEISTGFERRDARATLRGRFELFPDEAGYVPVPVGLVELWPTAAFGLRLRRDAVGNFAMLPPVPKSIELSFAAGAPAPEPGAAERARALELPPLSPSVRALASRLVPDGTPPAEAVARIARYLSGFAYSREVQGGPQPLDAFLARREGHCELFATALAVLLRARGIPARYVAGYYAPESIDGNLTIRDWDAHAWTEVLLPGRGFVPFDATPQALRGGQAHRGTLWSRLLDGWDRAQLRWLRGVVDFDQRSQVETAGWLGVHLLALGRGMGKLLGLLLA
ncbi:MAG: transglutaminase family protein, partial [Deltaproteobacteria bacterium]